MTAVQPLGRFGALNIVSDNTVQNFLEKPKGDGQWVNGGFFVLSKKIFNYITGDESVWEKESLENLAKDSNLKSFKHNDFWQPMDTLRDKEFLESLWKSKKAPWKIW